MSKINFIPAICPSCGGELRVPDNMGVVKCMYCGNDIIIQITQEETKSGANIKALLDLARTAEELENYDEAKNYYIQILEYDSENMYGWLGRGYCEGMLSTVVSSEKIIDGITYIDKGFGIEGKEESIIQLLEKFPGDYIILAKRYLVNIHDHWRHCCFDSNIVTLSEVKSTTINVCYFLRILDWLYILDYDDPDKQKLLKDAIVKCVDLVVTYFPLDCDDDEIKQRYIKMALKKSKLWNDPDIWAKVIKAKEEKNQIKPTGTKKKRWWS